MNKKISGIFVCMLLITAIVPLTVAIDVENDNITKPVSTGFAKKGIIVVELTEIEGAPEEFYVGSLKDVDFQLRNVSLFVVLPLPFLILPTVLENTDNIHLQIENFWGITDPATPIESSMIWGYFRNAEWEW